MNITASELQQLDFAINMFKENPDRLKKLYMDGRLRLADSAMFVLYLYYLGNIDFKDITGEHKEIALLFTQ